MLQLVRLASLWSKSALFQVCWRHEVHLQHKYIIAFDDVPTYSLAEPSKFSLGHRDMSPAGLDKQTEMDTT